MAPSFDRCLGNLVRFCAVYREEFFKTKDTYDIEAHRATRDELSRAVYDLLDSFGDRDTQSLCHGYQDLPVLNSVEVDNIHKRICKVVHRLLEKDAVDEYDSRAWSRELAVTDFAREIYLVVNPIGKAFRLFLSGEIGALCCMNRIGLFPESMTPRKVEMLRFFASLKLQEFPGGIPDVCIGDVMTLLEAPETPLLDKATWDEIHKFAETFIEGQTTPDNFFAFLETVSPDPNKMHNWVYFAYHILSGCPEDIDREALREILAQEYEERSPNEAWLDTALDAPHVTDRLEAISRMAGPVARQRWLDLVHSVPAEERDDEFGYYPDCDTTGYDENPLPVFLIPFCRALPDLNGRGILTAFRGTSTREWKYASTDPLFTTPLWEIFDILTPEDLAKLGIPF